MIDLRLADVSVIVDAFDLEVIAPDQARWGGNTSTRRRALVHAHGDQLVVNYDRDYHGGVKLEGNLYAEGHVYISGGIVMTGNDFKMKSENDSVARAIDVVLRNQSPRRSLRINPNTEYDRVTVKGESIWVEGEVEFSYPSRDGGLPEHITLRDLVEKLALLESQVAELRDRP